MSRHRRPPVTKCKSCQESIVWCETEGGKRMPVDIAPTESGNLQLTPRGPRPPLATVVSEGGRRPGQKLHTSHFATCKDSKQHRRDPTPQRQAAAPGQGELFDPAPTTRRSRR